jgi:2,3-bisphosphoglycerate-independent phosphoglycerate mutase
MDSRRTSKTGISRRSSVVLVVLDGWGISDSDQYNAIALAKTPEFEKLKETYGSIKLCASGECVGLSPGQMGNSEVGHLTLGSGRVIFQDLMRVSEEIESGRLAKNRDLQQAFRKLRKSGASLHLIGLVSNGGVHSQIDHLFDLLRISKAAKVQRVNVHAILDGRDTPPKSGIDFAGSLCSYLQDLGIGKISTISGRYYAMDRDGRWERTKLAYDAIVHGIGEHFDEPLQAIAESYKADVTDEFAVPRVIDDYNGMKDGDVVLFFNFRPDRARQLTRALFQSDKEFEHLFDRGKRPRKIEIISMTIYDSKFKRVKALLGREHVPNTLSVVLEKNGIRQLRIAETEKYAHVTYFFNGLLESPRKLEDRILVPSAREVGTYDKKPEMKASEISDEAIKAIESRKYGFVLINFANADMVGHSGNIDATVRAVEAVDSSLGRIYDSVQKLKAAGVEPPTLFITADHGNAEKMYDPVTRQPHTAHTSNLVPLILVSDNWETSVPSNYNPGLIDVAPSILEVMDLPKPPAMSGVPIVKRKLNSRPVKHVI